MIADRHLILDIIADVKADPDAKILFYKNKVKMGFLIDLLPCPKRLPGAAWAAPKPGVLPGVDPSFMYEDPSFMYEFAGFYTVRYGAEKPGFLPWTSDIFIKSVIENAVFKHDGNNCFGLYIVE